MEQELKPKQSLCNSSFRLCGDKVSNLRKSDRLHVSITQTQITCSRCTFSEPWKKGDCYGCEVWQFFRSIKPHWAPVYFCRWKPRRTRAERAKTREVQKQNKFSDMKPEAKEALRADGVSWSSAELRERIFKRRQKHRAFPRTGKRAAGYDVSQSGVRIISPRVRLYFYSRIVERPVGLLSVSYVRERYIYMELQRIQICEVSMEHGGGAFRSTFLHEIVLHGLTSLWISRAWPTITIQTQHYKYNWYGYNQFLSKYRLIS